MSDDEYTLSSPGYGQQISRREMGYPSDTQDACEMAGIGGGPRFRTAGRDILYEVAALDTFAETRISRRDFRSTADLKAAEAT